MSQFGLKTALSLLGAIIAVGKLALQAVVRAHSGSRMAMSSNFCSLVAPYSPMPSRHSCARAPPRSTGPAWDIHRSGLIQYCSWGDRRGAPGHMIGGLDDED